MRARQRRAATWPGVLHRGFRQGEIFVPCHGNAKKNDRAVLDADAKGNLKASKKQIDAATKFIPLWVKLSSPLAAGKRLHCVP